MEKLEKFYFCGTLFKRPMSDSTARDHAAQDCQDLNPLCDLQDLKGVALCLNSSFFGFYAHCGFLQGLSQTYDLRQLSAMSGASAGALTAGLFCAGYRPEEIHDILFHPHFKRRFFDFGMLKRIPQVALNLKGQTGVVNGSRAKAHIEALLHAKHSTRIEDCTHPRLSVGVTDMKEGRSCMLTEGPLAAAIIASCAYPGIFTMQELEGHIYWDGGIANPCPIEHWAHDPKIHTILIHEITHENPPQAQDYRISQAYGGAHEIISEELFRLRKEKLEAAGKAVIRITTTTPIPGYFRRASCYHRCHQLGQESAAKLVGLPCEPSAVENLPCETTNTHTSSL